jgi:hypothetical protein
MACESLKILGNTSHSVTVSSVQNYQILNKVAHYLETRDQLVLTSLSPMGVSHSRLDASERNSRYKING